MLSYTSLLYFIIGLLVGLSNSQRIITNNGRNSGQNTEDAIQSIFNNINKAGGRTLGNVADTSISQGSVISGQQSTSGLGGSSSVLGGIDNNQGSLGLSQSNSGNFETVNDNQGGFGGQGSLSALGSSSSGMSGGFQNIQGSLGFSQSNSGNSDNQGGSRGVGSAGNSQGGSGLSVSTQSSSNGFDNTFSGTGSVQGGTNNGNQGGFGGVGSIGNSQGGSDSSVSGQSSSNGFDNTFSSTGSDQGGLGGTNNGNDGAGSSVNGINQGNNDQSSSSGIGNTQVNSDSTENGQGVIGGIGSGQIGGSQNGKEITSNINGGKKPTITGGKHHHLSPMPPFVFDKHHVPAGGFGHHPIPAYFPPYFGGGIEHHHVPYFGHLEEEEEEGAKKHHFRREVIALDYTPVKEEEQKPYIPIGVVSEIPQTEKSQTADSTKHHRIHMSGLNRHPHRPLLGLGKHHDSVPNTGKYDISIEKHHSNTESTEKPVEKQHHHHHHPHLRSHIPQLAVGKHHRTTITAEEGDRKTSTGLKHHHHRISSLGKHQRGGEESKKEVTPIVKTEEKFEPVPDNTVGLKPSYSQVDSEMKKPFIPVVEKETVPVSSSSGLGVENHHHHHIGTSLEKHHTYDQELRRDSIPVIETVPETKNVVQQSTSNSETPVERKFL